MTSRNAVPHTSQADEPELTARFIRLFARQPSTTELRRLRRSEAALHLRLPARTRRRLAAWIVQSS